MYQEKKILWDTIQIRYNPVNGLDLAVELAAPDSILVVFLKEEKLTFQIEEKQITVAGPDIIIIPSNYLTQKLVKLKNASQAMTLAIPKGLCLKEGNLAILNYVVQTLTTLKYIHIPYNEERAFEWRYMYVMLEKIIHIQTGKMDFLSDPDKYLTTILGTLLLELYSLLQCHPVKENSYNDFADLSKLIDFLKTTNDDLSIDRNTEYYAKKLLITKAKLQQICTSILGRTPTEILHSKIIDQAKILLTSSNKTIKEISYELGFSVPTNFNKFFLKNTQRTPGRYRMDFFPEEKEAETNRHTTA